VRESVAVSAGPVDVAVIGAGLVGLSVAYEASCLGASVAVIDAEHPGRATDAGAGILSPVTSGEPDAEVWDFLQAAGAHYPALMDRLRQDGADVDAASYATCGLLSLSLRPHEDEWFDPFVRQAMLRAPGHAHEVTPAEAVELFPPLADVHRALHVPGAARVDGRGLASALRDAATARGIAFLTGVANGVGGSSGVAGHHLHRGTSVQMAGAPSVEADSIVVAGGAWSAALGETLGCRLPVSPTKGQIVHLGVTRDTGEWPIAQPLLSHYIVPWPGGRVACGGTFEAAAGFSATATAAGLHELLRECLTVAPGLCDASYLETRVGLRPWSADERALVGALPGWTNVFVATGHGANGLLQGPYSGRLLAQLMSGSARGDDAPVPHVFDPARFG
jgi:D-amino-acid dehydrogenase